MIVVPIRTTGGMNSREHWRARTARVKGERSTVNAYLGFRTRPEIPCTVTLTRLGPSNGLDDDNLAGSLKAVRDEIAMWLGVDDKDTARVRYRYEQARADEWGVRIEFGPHCEGCNLAQAGRPALYVAACPGCKARMLTEIRPDTAAGDGHLREACGA